jgi:hypothetical protein
MVPVSTYVFIYGVPVAAILFSVFLYMYGKKLFGAADSNERNGKKQQ